MRRFTAADGKVHDYVNTAVFGEPKLVLRLEEPTTIIDLFGRAKTTSLIGITVDDNDAFQKELRRQVR